MRDLVNRFANCFDLTDGEDLQACLCAPVSTDYSDLCGTSPETLSNRRFEGLCRNVLESLVTQYGIGNHEMEVEGNTAKAVSPCLIFR